MTLFTRQNVTLLLSIIGTLGTVYTLISTLIFQRKSLRIEVLGFSVNPDRADGLMYITVENLSRLPIAITSIEIVFSDVFIPCSHESVRIGEHIRRIGGETVERGPHYSINFPIKLSSLGASSGYLHFDNIPRTLSELPKEVTLQVQTNRGSVKKSKLSIHQESLTFLSNL